MIEFVRFFLSTVVAEAHLWPVGAPWLAWSAVFAFYTLSGYLIVRVLNERYGFSADGFLIFAANRFLRLWPAYLIVALLSIIVLHFLRAGGTIGALALPLSPRVAVLNFTILGIVGVDNQQMTLGLLVPNAWSLSVEICSYLLLGLYFGRCPARLLAFGAIGLVGIFASTVSCATSAFDYGAPYCFQNRYTVLQAGFAPFAMGGLIYFYKSRIGPIVLRYRITIAVALIASLFATWWLPVLQFTVAPFLGSLGMAALIAASRTERRLPLAEFFGRASYHLFITHWTTGALLIFRFGWPAEHASVMFGSIGISLFLSLGLVQMEKKIEGLRRSLLVRRSGRSRVALRAGETEEVLS
jgi:peptidoglycan/LPS O-acetylase OafA/YrhL